MATKAEGIWGCTVLNGKAGEDDRGITVQINVQIDDGPDKGQRCTYEDTIDAKTGKYISWSCSAVGWTGGPMRDLEKDINAWIAKTGGKTTVEIKHLEIKNGKKAGQIWDKVAGIGRGTPRQLKPLTDGEKLTDADALMREFAGTPDEDKLPF